jgi:hypothetical protein
MKHNDHIEDTTTTSSSSISSSLALSASLPPLVPTLMQSNEDKQPEGVPIYQRVNQIPNETFFLMKTRRNNGVSYRQIAHEFGLSLYTVRKLFHQDEQGTRPLNPQPVTLYAISSSFLSCKRI